MVFNLKRKAPKHWVLEDSHQRYARGQKVKTPLGREVRSAFPLSYLSVQPFLAKSDFHKWAWWEDESCEWDLFGATQRMTFI